MAHNAPQLLSALSRLVPGVYTVKSSTKGGLDGLADKLAGLEVADNTAEFTSLLLLFHLAHSDSRSAFHSTLIELTAPHKRPLQSPFDNDPPCSPPAEPFLTRSALTYALRASRALAPDTFSPIEYFSLLTDPSASVYERMLLSWAEGRVRDRVLEIVQRAYRNIGMNWTGRLTGQSEEDAHAWVEMRPADAKASDGKSRVG